MAQTQIHCIPAVDQLSVTKPPHNSAGKSLHSPNSVAVIQFNAREFSWKRANSSTERSNGGFFPSVNPTRLRRSATSADDRTPPQTNWKFDVTERNMKSKFALRKEYRPTLPKFCFSASAYQTVLTDSSSFCEDISKLPPPRHTLMTRELPYVYRYKIQQGITSLSNMIPSRRSHTTSNIW